MRSSPSCSSRTCSSSTCSSTTSRTPASPRPRSRRCARSSRGPRSGRRAGPHSASNSSCIRLRCFLTPLSSLPPTASRAGELVQPHDQLQGGERGGADGQARRAWPAHFGQDVAPAPPRARLVAAAHRDAGRGHVPRRQAVRRRGRGASRRHLSTCLGTLTLLVLPLVLLSLTATRRSFAACRWTSPSRRCSSRCSPWPTTPSTQSCARRTST